MKLSKLNESKQFIENLLPKAGQTLPIILCVLAVGVVIPFIEEVIFRGILYQGLKSKLPVWAALIISSTVFALIHVELGTLIPIFFMGLIFAYAYEKTNSIIIPIAIHLLNNVVSLIVIFYFK